MKTAFTTRSGGPRARIATRFIVCAALYAPLCLSAAAGEADVVGVRASQTGPGVWRFDVTVKHADSGWEHYADRFDVVGPDGRELGVRVLAHPHENEQPFTRSLGGVKIPENTAYVTIRAHDSVHGLGGAEAKAPLQ